MEKCRKCQLRFKPKFWQIQKSDYECPACKRKRQNEFNSNDPNFLKKHRANYKKRKKWYLDYQKRIRSSPEGKLKQKARRKLHYELECGRITKASVCELCKKNKRIEAHHHKGYENPTQVQWLCRACHINKHRS